MAIAWVEIFAKKFVTAIKANAGIVAQVSTRVYAQGTKINATLPCVTYAFPLSDVSAHVFGSNAVASEAVTFQVDAWGRTYTEAVAVLDAVIAACDGMVLTVTGWGTPRLTGLGGTILTEELDGVLVYRGMRRYRALLAGTY